MSYVYDSQCHVIRIMSHGMYRVVSHVSCHIARIMSCHVTRIMLRRTYHVTSHVSGHLARIILCRTYHVTSHVSCSVARIMFCRMYHVTSHVSCYVVRMSIYARCIPPLAQKGASNNETLLSNLANSTTYHKHSLITTWICPHYPSDGVGCRRDVDWSMSLPSSALFSH
jgi:hypothetical protein